jgi:hypothetical protein
MQHTLSQASTTKISSNLPWLMLFSRVSFFIGFQALFVLGFWLAGSATAWDASAAWWPFTVTLTNGVCLLAMIGLFRSEGGNYWNIFRFRRETLKGDLLWLFATLVLLVPVSFLPNIMIANGLFGNAQLALDVLVRPLPLWAAYAGLVLFPVTQGLAELATYFAYVMPRLESQGMPRWQAVVLPSLILGLQHIAVPLLFDTRFIIWRAFMFMPFAFLVGIVLRWRPSLLPYLAVIHVLLDTTFAAMLLSVAY